jgi:hypothetical protein
MSLKNYSNAVVRYYCRDLPSNGQTILKVTSSDTMLDCIYLHSSINKRQKKTIDLSWENPIQPFLEIFCPNKSNLEPTDKP